MEVTVYVRGWPQLSLEPRRLTWSRICAETNHGTGRRGRSYDRQARIKKQRRGEQRRTNLLEIEGSFLFYPHSYCRVRCSLHSGKYHHIVSHREGTKHCNIATPLPRYPTRKAGRVSISIFYYCLIQPSVVDSYSQLPEICHTQLEPLSLRI